MKIDYDVLSKDYDLTRSINIDTIKRILSKAAVDENTVILDFGCGTGNYACAIKRLTDAEIYGVDPSAGMRKKAQEKSNAVGVLEGDHTNIPLSDSFVDFVYMTDVIHHVPDVKAMFTEFHRVLKTNGMVCVLTESHKQIESRFWSDYFPATVARERQRYPDIPEIIASASDCGFMLDEIMVTDMEREFIISGDFVNLVRNKRFSMFRLIGDEDFYIGLERLEKDHNNKVSIISNHGETLLWLKKD